MFAAASILFSKTSYLSAYTLNSPTPSPSASATNLPSTSTPTPSSLISDYQKSFNVGLWKVTPAMHKTTGKEVSVWIFEKRVLEGIKGGVGFGGMGGKEWVVEQLRKEASSLSRLRHPDILHMVEPLEESRSELVFITERIISSLSSLAAAARSSTNYRPGRPPAADEIGMSGRGEGELDLDEVEIQKGSLQLARGLGFLHNQAKMVHLNLGLEAVVINAKPDGSATKYVYPEVDARLPPQVQWKLDYLAPEYALDSTLSTSNDLYSLGCILYAVHMGGKPPFSNRGSMQNLRDNAEGKLLRRAWASGPRWERCSSELKDLLPRLLTRHPSTRISLLSLPSHPFFSSLAISTLNFLDPTTFASKPREEKATFLRGLIRVVPTFSERLRKGKVLPSLLEEMKDPYLLPFILPNVFEISKGLSKDEFSKVLNKLRPLFTLKDPPQNMLTLLEHLGLFEEKTTPQVFRENVMPLVYNSLESEHLPVQERVLKTIPHLCEILDYGTVQNVLLVKVAIVFTRTRILSVKVQTLDCFKAMVGTLDKATLTSKLVPLLAKIKTKEPAVMMATLAVHEAMGAKVDREATATLVLPQLWSMSMGPLLNAEQFRKFMAVIKTLGARVEAEHTKHLRDVHLIEAQTASLAAANAAALNAGSFGRVAQSNGDGGGDVDFEALVRGNGSGMGSSGSVVPTVGVTGVTDPWDDEGWLNNTPSTAIANNNDSGLTSVFPSLSLGINNTGNSFPITTPASVSPRPLSANTTGASLKPSTSATTTTTSTKLKARPIPASSFNSAAFGSSTSSAGNVSTPLTSSGLPPLQPTTSSFAPLQPQVHPQPGRSTLYTSNVSSSGSGPNYNISLTPQSPAQTQSQHLSSPLSFMPSQMSQPTSFSQPVLAQALAPRQQHQQPQLQAPAAAPLAPQSVISPPPGWSTGVMQPTAAPKPVWGKSSGGTGALDWGDLDPLK
ncbi:SCY1 protein kinase [Cryptococcus deuterogattii 99/473]|uniref:SCY1 protein kinase n=1 Tax=Cryptococcus deuterogattii Ram5 TaxID=1296110 RepID=A0A0D0U509_9TREE|nr:SCY1 protein kinase [Cryptococcus deuterogattii Ram5]KIY56889.1 SCY1 protein kinase [Cryptococcus deuterogattii 99/473]